MTKKKTKKKAPSKTPAQSKAEEMRKLAKEMDEAKKKEKEKPTRKWKSLSIGRGTRDRWTTIVEHIEDGKIVKRETLVANTGKMDALHKFKLFVTRQFLRGSQKIDWK